MTELPVPSVVALAGFAGGLLFGAVVQRTHFCTMGAIADLVLFGDWRRMRAWLLAIAVALLGSQALDAAGVVELGQSVYRAGDILWLGALLGGLIFGFGMTLTGGCSSRNLVRCGAGNLKSLVVLLIMGVVAAATATGLLALPRVRLDQAGSLASGDQAIAVLFGWGDRGAIGLALVAGTALAGFCFKDGRFRRSRKDVVAGLVIGALIPFGWLATGMLAAAGAEHVPLASFTFVAPVGEALIALMAAPGSTISFGIAAVSGVLAGGFVAAKAAGDFRLEGFAGVPDLVRHMAGAAMMGAGGVLALGCTIGQGITGLSTLAAGSLLATLSIIAGGVLGVRYLERGSLIAALRALVPGPGPESSQG